MTHAAPVAARVDPGPRANPLATNPLRTRHDLARAVVDLHRPLAPYVVDDARVRLGSFGVRFEQASAELEGFARPLYGIVPLVAGGGTFDGWSGVRAGLVAGTDPGHPGYWGAITRDADQRMVEQAAIGIALAFCPEHVWEPLDITARDRLVEWLQGIAAHEPVRNNWQFFRVLVALGLERVGHPMDAGPLESSLDMLESFRRGDHWYVDGDLRNVDFYIPMAFHTYGLMYAAANDRGLGDDARAEAYRARARAFAQDFAHWFGPDGAAVAMGRSLTYRFALASFWGALAWADVEPEMGWGAAKGMLLRHVRWWRERPICDRDGVLSVGYSYSNRTMRESYNSAGSPYWALKAFAALGAPDDHPFWTSDEEQHPVDASVYAIPDAGRLIRTDDVQTVTLMAATGPDLAVPEQAAAKYRKFAYSSRHALCGEVADFVGRIATDSTLVVTDDEGNRHARLAIEAAGIEDRFAWSTWRPCRGVRVDTVLCFDDDPGWGGWHLRLHRVRSDREITTAEYGFALGCNAPTDPDAARREADEGTAAARTWDGDSRIVDLSPAPRAAGVHELAVDANIVHPNAVVPVLTAALAPGTTELACAVRAHPDAPTGPPPAIDPAARRILERIGATG